MAILNDLIVRGATRCLNTLYANSLQVDSQTISGNLTVNGYTYMGYSTSRSDTKLSVAGITNNQWYRSTGSVGWYNDSYGGGIYMTDPTYVKTYNNKAFYAYNGLYTGSTQQYYLNVNGKLNAADGVFSNNLNVGNSLVSRNISATNLLRAAKYDLQTITQVGSNGTLYVAPSIQFPTSNTTSVAAASTSITIIDTNITSDVMAGVVWRPSAKVKISGTINGVVTGTVDGTITSINTSSKTMVIGNLSGGNWSSVVAGTYTKDKIENLNIMMYETYQNSTYYPVGILLTSYGSVGEHTDGTAKTFIDIYGGSATKPVVRLGSMTGLDAINGVTPSGWGLYTSNGYFSGLIVSTSGKIGGWSLSTNSLTTGTWGSNGSAMLCTGSTGQKSIGGSPASTSGWVFTAGANFGVTSSGALYANSAHISGEITATSGTIGGASITNGVLLVKDANISGKISASHIDVSSITIGSLSGADNYALKDDVPTTVAELTDSGSYLTTSAASNTYATQTNLNNEINARKAVYGTSSTDAGTTTKAVTCSNFALYTGASVTVTFSKTNTSSAPQLNVNSTGAKPIKSYTGANLTEGEYKWAAGATITFTYDGTNWRMQDGGALQAKIDAASSASTASSQAGVATQQATNATNAKTAAESAKTAAESAKTAAQSAKTAAETASSQASSAKDTAVSAKNDAVSAKTDAETAKGQAQTAAGNASQSATNAANSATAAAEVMGGFTILWNYSAFGTSDNGEGYLCAFDPATGTKSDANGWVKWNGVKRTITKQMINPNTVLPYNIPIYVVCRLSSATATTGTNYMVWYNSGWKYAVMPTPTTVGGSWTWADNTDIILGKFVETASEAALTEYEIYNPPYTSKQITTNVVTAQSASASAASAAASAASAAQTATTYITNIDSNNGIRIQPVNYSANKDSVQINSTAITMYRNDVDVMSLGDSSFRMGTASGKHTTVNSDGLHVWIGSESTAANEVGLFGSTARIGAPASSRFLLNADSLQAYNSSNVKYFEVSASGLSFGGNAVAKASDIPTTVSQLTDSGNYLTTTVAANTYATQSNFDSLREDFDNYVAPIASKEYLNIIATANDDAKGTFYFGKIKPVDYYTPWKIKYRVQVKINGITDGYETSDIIISGAKNTYYAYQTYNSITNTSYRPYYYHILYTCTQTGINNGYGHLFGISLRYSYNPTTTSNARKINVDVVETEGCTVTLEDAPFLYANAAGKGSTNYVNRYSFDATTQGYTESGDRNETNHILNNFSGKTGAKGVWGGSLFMKDGNGKYQNICLASDGTATSASSGNGARTVATTKIVNPNGFEVGGSIYYSGTSYNANTNMSSNNVYASYGAFDSRYSINSTLTANFLTPYAPIYLVGTINQTDNLFYLDSTWWTQTANNKNKVYIYIGNVYDSTTSYCRFSLAEDNTWLVYDGSKLINYQKNESDNAAKTATSYITYVNATDGIKVHNASDTTNYLQLNSSAISMYKGGTKIFNTDSNGYVTVGKVAASRRNVYITDDAVQIRNNTSVLAEYGSSIKLYKPSTTTTAVEISSTGATFTGNVIATSLSTGTKTASTTGKGTYIDGSGNIYVGNGSTNNFTVTDTGTITATGANLLTATIGNATNKISIGTGTSGHSSIQYGMTTLADTSHDGFYIGTDGIALGKGTFKVTAAGDVTATSLFIGINQVTNLQTTLEGKQAAGDYATNTDLVDAIDNIQVGGRNLIINTLTPDATAAKRPKIIGQTVDTVGRDSASVAEHGIRFTTTSESYSYIYMGFTGLTNGTGATLQGLTAGETYTFSCDFTCKIFSADTSTTTRYLRFYLYDDTSGSFALDKYQNMVVLDASKKGTEQSGYFCYTFTLPVNITKFGFMIRTNVTTSGLFATGEFIELRNIKLEKGNKATDWTPAPEDVEIDIEEAKKVATNYLSTDNTGIMVANMEDGEQTPSTATGRNVFIDSDSVNIRDGQKTLASFRGEDTKFYDVNSDNKEVASFGSNGVCVGNKDEQHFIVDTESIQAINENGSPIFSVTSTGGTITTDVVVAKGGNSQGYTLEVILSGMKANENTQFYVDSLIQNVDVLWSTTPFDSFYVDGETASVVCLPHNDPDTGTPLDSRHRVELPSFLFTYGTPQHKYYHLRGTFVSNGGNTYEYVGTIHIQYDGQYKILMYAPYNSLAKTDGNVEEDVDIGGWCMYIWSDIKSNLGYSKAPAMTFGTRSNRSVISPLSVTIGEELYANCENQLSIGKYNLNNDEFNSLAFVIGNGIDDTDRSNAFSVDWDGDAKLSGNLTVAKNINVAENINVTGRLTSDGNSGLFTLDTASIVISSIGTNASCRGNIDITKSGYTPIAIAGFGITGDNGWCVFPRCYITKGEPDSTIDYLNFYIWNQNTRTSFSNVTIEVKILYIASSAF